MARNVLFIHGLWDKSDIFDDMIAALDSKDVNCITMNWVPNNGAKPIAEYAQQLADQISGLDKVSIVAFSMGGIISRYAIQKMQLSNIEQLITIASPHQGTVFAIAYAPIKKRRVGVYQLARKSPLLQELNSLPMPIPMTCIWSPYDPIIVPLHSATHEAATNIKVRVALHDRLPAHKTVIREIASAIRSSAF